MRNYREELHEMIKGVSAYQMPLKLLRLFSDTLDELEATQNALDAFRITGATLDEMIESHRRKY